MDKNDIDVISHYYNQELEYLREAGTYFSTKFPKIAKRLDFSHTQSCDPHVERLLESFAFLTGNLQKQIDDSFPRFANALLEILYKPLVTSTPSAAIAHFEIDKKRISKYFNITIPKGTKLHTTSNDTAISTFITSEKLDLVPIQIVDAKVITKEELISKTSISEIYYLKLQCNWLGKPAPLDNDINVKFYLNGDLFIKSKIFAALFSSNSPVLLQTSDNIIETLNPIYPIGLDTDQALYPYPSTIHQGFRLLHEYFSFCEKFYGFDIKLTKNTHFNKEFYLYVPLAQHIDRISINNFLLNSVPIVNIFSKISEPIIADGTKLNYKLIPDAYAYESTDIYSIQKIVQINKNTNDTTDVPNFFNHSSDNLECHPQIFWTSSISHNKSQTNDLYISFINTNFDPCTDNENIFFAHILCTNKNAPHKLPAGSQLQVEISLPIETIFCIDRPTPSQPPPSDDKKLWQLISALSLNSLSFQQNGIAKLKSILNIFADLSHSSLISEINSIVSLDVNQLSVQIDKSIIKGFATGYDVNITFDQDIQNLGLPLSCVLSKFFEMYVGINNFCRVNVLNTRKHGILKKWKTTQGIAPNL